MIYIYKLYNSTLEELDSTKKLITTLNAHSYNTLQSDKTFGEALKASHVLLPDGVSMVWASQFLLGKKIKKIAGHDLFFYEMNKVHKTGGKVFFLGSSEKTLKEIKHKAGIEYPNVEVHYYSPPYKTTFSDEESRQMVNAVNKVNPEVLFVGMTAPKQEKWAFQHFDQLNANHICCIGAVFDFYAGTVKRAPKWMINIGLEWFYRLLREPKRMWRRYIIGNPLFLRNILHKKIKVSDNESINHDFLKGDFLQD